MSLQMQEALEKVITSEFMVEPDFTKYLWKGPKTINPDGTVHQEEYKLIECTEAQLLGFLKHAVQMLENKDMKNPGRFKVRKEIFTQIHKCNAELFIREQINRSVTRFNFLSIIREYLHANNITQTDLKGLTLKDIIKNDLYEYADIPVDIVIEACLDKAGLFNKQHLTTTFVLKQGVWLTHEEYQEHIDSIKGKAKKQVEEYLKLTLGVNPKHNLRITSSGLTLAEMKEALAVKEVKYSAMGGEKLRILRDKLLFALLKDVDDHINQWNNLIANIEEVLNYKRQGNVSVSNNEG
jgi:hypothetical protein